MVRCTTTVKKGDKDLAVIILTQDFTPRGRPRSNTIVRANQSLLDYQTEIITDVFPGAEINVVLTHNPLEVIKQTTNKNIKYIRNERYAETNDAHSLALGLQATTKNNCLIIDGNLYFNRNAIKDMCQLDNMINVDTSGAFSKSDVGILCDKDEIINFSYSFDIKWGKIAYISNTGTHILRKLLSQENIDKLFMFEILNKLLDEEKVFIYKTKGVTIYEV